MTDKIRKKAGLSLVLADHFQDVPMVVVSGPDLNNEFEDESRCRRFVEFRYDALLIVGSYEESPDQKIIRFEVCQTDSAPEECGDGSHI